MLPELTYYTDALGIVGDMHKVRARNISFNGLALEENYDGGM